MVILRTLLENELSKNRALIAEHGLSFLVETGKKKILFDCSAGKAVKTHTTLGADMLSKVTQLSAGENNFMNYAFNMCRSHHERWDGKGYPDRLEGEKIPLEARALAIVNTYDNFRNIAVAGKTLSHQEAIMKIKFMKFTCFDPALVDIFLSVESEIKSVAG